MYNCTSRGSARHYPSPGRTRGFTLSELLLVIVIIAILVAILYPVFARAREKDDAATCLSNMKNIGTGLAMYTVDYNDALIKEYFGFPAVDSFGMPKWASQPSSPPTRVLYYDWRYALEPYLASDTAFECPSDALTDNKAFWTSATSLVNGTKTHFMPASFATNQAVFGFANGTDMRLTSGLSQDTDITDPANTITVADSRDFWMDQKINWIGSAIGNPADPAGRDPGLPGMAGVTGIAGAYQGGATPCASPSNPEGTTATVAQCPLLGEGPFQSHQGLVNFVFADGHSSAMKLAATAVPNDLWDSGLTLSQREKILSTMNTEYRQ
jgi:prepilin-type N-terminal cleavage/methylation domain-containing protein/prepilin-type processing-associated H-X9-DG protein